MHSNVALAFRLLRVLAGLSLILIGTGLFVIFTGGINEALSMGGPMNFGFTEMFFYWPVVLFLDVIFVSLILGGVKLAGFAWRIFGLIILVAGLGILILGIWHHVTGPPVDYDSSLPERTKLAVPPELNLIVYFWSGVTLLAGLWLTVFPPKPEEIE